MHRSMIALCILAGWACRLEAGPIVTITSNNFSAFAAAVQNAAPGTTFNFNLGSNSTITFSSRITVPNNIAFVGDNSVTFDGGGNSLLFFIPSTSTASFSGFTFQNASQLNIGDGAIYSPGHLAVTNSRFFHNHANNIGGAITGNMTVSNCLFAFNDAVNAGGAISGLGPSQMLIENCTFFSNQAGNTGGAIAGGTATNTLFNCTIFANGSGNVGGGIEVVSQGAMLINSCIVAGNTSNTSVKDLNANNSATVLHSVIGNPAGNNLVNGVNGNIVGNGTSFGAFPIANLLGPLQDNGGTTQTMELLNFGALTNPAIDSGSNPNNLQFDQRGTPFTRAFNAGVDIGAFEVQPVPEGSSLYLALLGGVFSLIAYHRSNVSSLSLK